MILVNKNFMTPRTTNVVTLEDKSGDFIYVDRNLYDNAVIFNHTTQGDTNKMDKMVLGENLKNKVNPDVLTLMLDIYATAPEPINMLVPFMMIADGITVPEGLSPEETKSFGYNLLDVITNSIDVRTYVKLPAQMRSNLTGIQHLAKTFRERAAHTVGMWFTGVETVVIKNVQYANVYENVQPAVQVATPTTVAEPVTHAPTPLPVPAGSITTTPAPDKETATPMANTISEEEYEAMMKAMMEDDEEFEQRQKDREKKKTEAPKQVEVSKEMSDRAEVNSMFASILAGL